MSAAAGATENSEIWFLSELSTVYCTPDAKVSCFLREWRAEFGPFVDVQVEESLFGSHDRATVIRRLVSMSSEASANHISPTVIVYKVCTSEKLYAVPGAIWLKARAACSQKSSSRTQQSDVDALLNKAFHDNRRQLQSRAIHIDEQDYGIPIAESSAEQHPLPRAIDNLCMLALISAAAALCTLYYKTTTPRIHFTMLGFVALLPSTAVFIMFHRMRMSEQRIRLIQGGDYESTTHTAMSPLPVYSFWCYATAFFLFLFITLNPASDHMASATIGTCVLGFVLSLLGFIVFLVRFKNSLIIAGV